MLVLWMGCVASEVVLTGPGEDREDTAVDVVDSAAPEPDSGEEEEDPSFEETLDFTEWDGTLRFDGGGCAEEVGERGPLLSADSRPDLYAACGDCEMIFSLTPSAASACSIGGRYSVALAQPTHRGLKVGDGWALVYDIEDGAARLLDSGGTFEDGTLRFSYTETVASTRVAVSGTVGFPSAEE